MSKNSTSLYSGNNHINIQAGLENFKNQLGGAKKSDDDDIDEVDDDDNDENDDIDDINDDDDDDDEDNDEEEEDNDIENNDYANNNKKNRKSTILKTKIQQSLNEDEDIDPDADIEPDGEDDGDDKESDIESDNDDNDDKDKNDHDGDNDEITNKCYSKYAAGDDADLEALFENDNTEIIKTKRLSKPVLFKYEKVRILSTRARQLAQGAKQMIKNTTGLSSKEIALMELKQKLIPMKIIRPIPNAGVETWSLSELEIPNYDEP